MIRVNLLRNRKEGLSGLVSEPAGASSFISGREVLLAAVFLALGGTILWFVLGNQAGSDPAVASGTVEGSAPAANPAPAAASGTPQATVPLAPSPTSGRATVSVPPSRAPAAAAVASPPPNAPAPSSTTPPTSAGTGGSRGSTLLSNRSTAASPAASSAASRTTTAAAARPTTGGAITMRELRVLGQGNALQIIAATNGQPEYNMFRVNNPDRIVIDLPGVRHEIAREHREQGLPNSIVKTVRVAQNQIEPPLVRLVLEVETFPELQILSRPDGLLINVAGK